MKRVVLVNLLLLPLLFSLEAVALFKSQPPTEILATQKFQYKVLLDVTKSQSTSLRLLAAPPGMRLLPNNTLVWQTDYEHAGEHRVVLRADDGVKPVQQAFTLLVRKNNRKPIFRSTPVRTGREGRYYSYQVDVVDPDDDYLNIEFVKYPKAAQIDGDTIRWDVGYGSAGSHPVVIRVSDGTDTVEQKYLLEISQVNRPPEFQAPAASPLTLREKQNWHYDVQVSDPDGDAIELSLRAAPEGMSLEGKTLYWMPSYSQSGDHTVEMVASDGELEATQTLQLHVSNVNRLPEITSTPPLTAIENAEYVYAIRAYDPDETLLEYTLLKAPEGMTLQDNQLRWTPEYGQAGKYEINFEVSDGEAAVNQAYTLTVQHKNREPVIKSQPKTTIEEAEVFTYEFEVHDPDGDKLTINYDIPEQVTRDGNKMYWQTTYKDAGDYPFVIQVKDKEATVEQRFILKVKNINHKPVFTSEPPTLAYEAVYYEYQLQAEDPDNEELFFDLEESPRGMHIKDGLIMWIPNFDQAGQHNVVATVTDGIDMVKQEFTIEVLDTNREPTIEEVEDQTLYVGQTIKIPLVVGDLDGDKLKTYVVYGPKGMRINRQNILTWKAGKNDIGTQEVIVEVSDGDLATRISFDVEVQAK